MIVRSRRHAALRFWVGAGILIVLVLLVVANQVLQLIGGSSRLSGTELAGDPAPDFRLTDQFGATVSLADLRGKVVVLTFLYTSCPDTCPLISGKLGQVHDLLGEEAGEVAFLAVTVDPERDTVARVKQYLDAQELTSKLRFLTRDRPTLEAVWAAYYIGVSRLPAGSGVAGSAVAYEVAHNDVVYLIDRAGRRRSMLREDFAPTDLLSSLRVLLRESPGGRP